MLYDSQGNLWVGTYGAGLSLFDKNARNLLPSPRKTDYRTPRSTRS
ncbi:two-component regulator propeller domain-containing protein [Paraflavitalea speifideaquila]